ncbi:hypothetical protein U1Q18_051504 [Sarracenia purpurea var. burkii]
MKDVINLCLPNVEDQSLYKRLIMESRGMQNRCEMSFNDSDLQNLKLNVQFYSRDVIVFQKYVKKILNSDKIEKVRYISDVDKWDQFSDFVDDVFSNEDILSRLNVKKSFIMSYASNCSYGWNDDNSLDEMIKVLGKVFTTNDELQLVKKMFLNSFSETLVSVGYWVWFEERFFDKFVSWCVDDKDGVIEFKKTINIDAIFDEYFDKFAESYYEDDSFDKELFLDLDKCLEWYFKCVIGVGNYKVGRIHLYREIELFNVIFARRDDESLKIMDNIPNGACEQGGENESNEKRFVLYVTLPSLEEMALHRVALALWYNYIHRMEYNEFEKKWAEKLLDTGIGITLKYWEDYDNTIESLKIPRSIKEKLETALDSVSNKTIWCLLHFKEYMFSEKLRKYSIDRFDVNCCVWLPNGKVDLGKTGLKLLSSRGLSDIQKIRHHV